MSQPDCDARLVREVVDAYEGRLLSYARSLVGCEDKARDIVQETFMRLCQSPPQVATLNGQLVSWLFTVCRNRALDVRRKDGRMLSLTQTTLDQRTTAAPSPVAVAEQVDAAAQVSAILAALPEAQQEVVRLKFQQGLSYREIAAVTGRTVSHVGVLLHTALKTIREKTGE